MRADRAAALGATLIARAVEGSHRPVTVAPSRDDRQPANRRKH